MYGLVFNDERGECKLLGVYPNKQEAEDDTPRDEDGKIDPRFGYIRVPDNVQVGDEYYLFPVG